MEEVQAKPLFPDGDATSTAKMRHVLQKVAVEIKHTPHQNQAALLGLQAYLYQLKGQTREALQSLKDAEEQERKDEQQTSAAGALIIYGNYAWIHYLRASYQEAESYLERIQQLCPAPWDARLVPYIQAQKGWSLLAIRARNGERARECFEVALMLEPGNRYFHAGLGMALYSSWSYFWYPDIARKAIIQLERTVLEQPSNYRAKIRLAKLLEQVDIERSISLIEESAEKSSDPDVLKASALFCLRRSTERAIEILQRALQQDPGYHLLYQALAKSYKVQWLNAKKEDKNNILEAAIKDLKQILQKHPDLDLVFVKLQLAEFYGARDPAQEEKIYKELQERKDTLSPKGHQALNLYWGKFFLYKKKSLEEAKAKFMDGYKIPVLTEQRKECAQRLIKMTRYCHSDDADAIHRFIQDTNRHLPTEFSGTNLD
ncbi:PREDICTED: interferon-induced protein with tetratricopeptide repeats 2-like [Cariama cristata]|uniref:interferon-induced protein with tetratricopeptide repeats 2-like n=1 Tax=Cariama cristata TaxID=54380 RepID=UPI0005208A4D|nr:PREDICTED: interferon-induced protein with tetratricopeptide repeats 2-like [Cariama cristata]